MEITHIILSLIIFMAGALSAYLLMLRVVGRHVAESAAKDALLERLREELGDANIKRAQVEERCNQLKAAIESEKENSAQMVKQIKELNDYALENIKAQLAHITEENLKLRGEELKNSNVEQLGHILAPLREQMRKMEESVRNVDISSAQHKVSIEKSIENLATQAVAVGKHADELARALKNNSKVQGDWGEQILESILESSGLRKGYEYVVQENVKDGKRDLRPDVIVCCPGGKKIIIDSKVSLTAYVDYLAAETKEEAEKHAKANKESIKKHIDELAAKGYSDIVANSMSHILMFVPNEGSYILALRSDPQIAQYAYRKGILLINPTNLMISLQLIYNMWQNERQTKNIEKVIKEGEALYEKFVGFYENWSKIKDQLSGVMALYDKADKQLCDGNGNIVRRLENLKKLGIMPKKNIPGELLERSLPDAPFEDEQAEDEEKI
ncbi:MAG: DNA recombination protein RmuC [Bacteroidaceae bacterium]|nr:DNA recombination protein RmuC [Bacteroidaceae bacterium]